MEPPVSTTNPVEGACGDALMHLDKARVPGDDFEERVLKSGKPVLVFFWAQWCEPCRRMAPAVVEVVRANRERLTLAAVDIDEDEHLAQQQSVAALPATILYREGEVVLRLDGRVEGEALERAVLQALEET